VIFIDLVWINRELALAAREARQMLVFLVPSVFCNLLRRVDPQ
jgi:hypothetical protein